MQKMPKVFYALLMLVLVLVLSGCELRRESSDLVEATPLSDLPPTLAPLGAETNSLAEATVVPTVINVQPTATQTTLKAGDAADLPQEPVAPAAAANNKPATTVTSEVAAKNNTGTGPAVTVNSVPTAEQAAISKPKPEQSIVVDATANLPLGGPVAANPPATQANGASATYGESSYLVRAGDTLFSIAQRYGTTVEAIAYANGLSSDMIAAGQTLSIPGGAVVNQQQPQQPQPAQQQPAYPAPAAPQQQPDYSAEQQQAYGYQQPDNQAGGYRQQQAIGGYHLVTPGETLYRIALQYGTSVEAIAAANNIGYPYNIQIGQQLAIPMAGGYGTAPNYPQQQQQNGYYPQQQQQQADPYYPQQQQQQGYDNYQQQQNGYYPQQQQGGNYSQQPQQADPYYPQQQQQGYGNYPQQPQNGYYPQQQQGGNNYGAAGTHTVAPGETLYSIAMSYGTNAAALAAANGLADPNQIYVGQVLYLP